MPALSWGDPVDDDGEFLLPVGTVTLLLAEPIRLRIGTVTTHLAHVYTKLGITSRSELVGAANRHRS